MESDYTKGYKLMLLQGWRLATIYTTRTKSNGTVRMESNEAT